MAIDIIKLNNNIRQLERFINDITYRAQGDRLAVPQITSGELKLPAAQAFYAGSNDNDSKPSSSLLKKTAGDKLIIPPTVTYYADIKARREDTKFLENKAVKDNMAKLKAWQSKSKEEKEAAAEMAHLSYIAVLKMLSDKKTMTNKNGQTPKDVAEKNSLTYMTMLFNNPENCIIPGAPVTAPASPPASVISSAAPTKRPTLNPIGVAIGVAVMQVLILLGAVLLDFAISIPGSQHVAPFLLNMPGLAIIGGIIGAVSIAHGLMAHIQNKAPSPEEHALSITAGPCVPLKSPYEVLQEEANSPLLIFGGSQTPAYPPLGEASRGQVPTDFVTRWKGNPNAIN